MTKVQAIWQFINFNHPTRKELTAFILGISVDNYDWSKHRGHYGTNIAEWKRKGHVVVINKKYTITPESLKDGTGRMYIALDVSIIALDVSIINNLERDNDNLRHRLIELKNINRVLLHDIQKANQKLYSINQLSQIK